jgi:ankyrin repeat protein
MRAALGGDDAMIRRLLAAGAHVNQADDNGWTALICAAAGDVTVVNRLIDAGADVSRSTKDGLTALKRAAASGHAATADSLQAAARLRAELG